jgi:hypothetical protein
MDDAGDLFVDPEHAARLTAHVATGLEAEALAALDARRSGTCRTLLEHVDVAGAAAASSLDGWATTLADLGLAVSDVVAHALLAKFAPAGLLARMANEGDHAPPPFPVPSPGGLLAVELREAAGQARAMGFTPGRLEAEWPDVPAEVAALIGGFCERHVGFGPIQWEVPGYETPQFALARMRGSFGSSLDAEPSESRRNRSAGPHPAPILPGSTRALLAGWLEFLELEIWYVRRAFLVGMVPLVRRLADALDVPPELLLFVNVDELGDLSRSLEVAESRRLAYAADHEYLALHRIDEHRPARALRPG